MHAFWAPCLVALLTGCAQGTDAGVDGIPTLLVAGEIVETHAGNGDQSSPVCSYDPGVEGDARDGRVRLSEPTRREAANASAVVILQTRVETDDDSLCGDGAGILILAGDAREIEIAHASAGIPALGTMHATSGSAVVFDGTTLVEGDAHAFERQGVRRSGFEGEFAYRATLEIEHLGCWAIEGRELRAASCT